jgi:hypothetical protein
MRRLTDTGTALSAGGMTVSGIRCAEQGGQCVLSASIGVGDKTHDVWYKVKGASLGQHPEAFLAATLLPAMKLRRPLRVSGAISPRLWNAVPAIQRIFRSWDGECGLIPVDVQRRERVAANAANGCACFFSGGVDSFFTLLQHRDQISTLIFVHGFDIPLPALRLRAKVSETIRAAAAELGKPLIEVETNLRDFSDLYVSWEHHNGAALASVALLLSSQFSHVYAAATHAFAAPFPWHRDMAFDAWSTERTQIVNDDGHEIPRVAKVAYISRDDVALKFLRVCGENHGDAYNCGVCEKCLRTMVALRIAGALDRCPAFARPLDLACVSRIVPGHNRYFIEENRDAALRSGTDPALVAALQDCLAGGHDGARRPLLRRGLHVARRLMATGSALVGRLLNGRRPPFE